MNIELLQQIKARILAEPDAFRMDTWSCGTAHCIAGWACALNGLTVKNPREHATAQTLTDGRYPGDVGAKLLGVRTPIADRLFMVSAWPKQFALAYLDTASRAERAQIAAERIDHFIATNGAE